MKKLLLMSALVVLAACGKKEAPAGGETTGEMAPAAADTGMGGMSHDSTADGAVVRHDDGPGQRQE